MAQLPAVVVAGELYIDLVLSGFDGWPTPGKEIFAKNFRRDIGGGAAITASALARLETHAGIFGVLGADSREWFLHRLAESRVDTAWIEQDDNEITAFSVVASAGGDRGFLSYHGANRRLPEILKQAAREKVFHGVRHVHLSYAPELETSAVLFENLRSAGCTVSLDVGWHEHWLANRDWFAVLQAIDIFFPNHVEATSMTGEQDPGKILDCFASQGLRRVALKLGSTGAALLWEGKRCTVPPHPVTTVDTTGAGDCFDAGFLHAWLNQWPPELCLQAGNICGALSTEAYGGIAGVPSAERLRDEMSGGPVCAK